jgi:hypothetical protein
MDIIATRSSSVYLVFPMRTMKLPSWFLIVVRVTGGWVSIIVVSPNLFPAAESLTGAEPRLAHSLRKDTDIRGCELLGMSLVCVHLVPMPSTFLNSILDPRLICMCTPVELT